MSLMPSKSKFQFVEWTKFWSRKRRAQQVWRLCSLPNFGDWMEVTRTRVVLGEPWPEIRVRSLGWCWSLSWEVIQAVAGQWGCIGLSVITGARSGCWPQAQTSSLAVMTGSLPAKVWLGARQPPPRPGPRQTQDAPRARLGSSPPCGTNQR